VVYNRRTRYIRDIGNLPVMLPYIILLNYQMHEIALQFVFGWYLSQTPSDPQPDKQKHSIAATIRLYASQVWHIPIFSSAEIA
jgi:hypothetical protein